LLTAGKQGTKSPAHIPALDGVRGSAAVAVFIYHYGGGASSSKPALHIFGEIVHLGWVGVSLFFVLSGFLITGILLDSFDRPGWCKTFYIRRTLRIFPLYYFVLIAGVILVPILRACWISIAEVWPFFFYLQDVPGLVRFELLNPLLTLGHFWSLAVEEQFYLCWPFLLFAANKRGLARPLCVTVFVLSLLFRICVFGFHLYWPWAGYFILGRAGEMAAGGFLAASLRRPGRTAHEVVRGAKPILAASLLGTLAIVIGARQNSAGEPWFGTLGLVFLSGLFASLIAISLQPGYTQRAFAWPPLRWLGRISYGIYVYHLLLYPLFAWIAGRLIPPSVGSRYLIALAFIAAAGTLVAAMLSFATVESAFLKLKDSVGKPHALTVMPDSRLTG
jgi:peptidoglycan/LPS O-acetylase OafA/YrhL